jgi:hypothetical protein
MTHRYKIGDGLYFHGQFGNGAKGVYKVMSQLPVERDDQRRYRIKNSAETFERIAMEDQLSREP